MLILSREPAFLARLEQLPPAWWEGLQGAPLLQCLLDAAGDESHIPPEALAQLRHFEARWSVKDEAELVPDQTILKLELNFVEREKQAVNRQLLDPGALVDPTLQRRLMERQATLLGRAQQLRTQLAALRRQAFSR